MSSAARVPELPAPSRGVPSCAAQVESLFNTTLTAYHHVPKGKVVHR
jgi:hypothetical protein